MKKKMKWNKIITIIYKKENCWLNSDLLIKEFT